MNTDSLYTLFKIQDINAIIKIFAYNIQDKIEEMDGVCHSHDLINQKNDDSSYYIRKYKGYISNIP